jgi:hypothetical protein
VVVVTGVAYVATTIIDNHRIHGPSIGVHGPILCWDRVSNGSIARYATASCAYVTMYLFTSTVLPLVLRTHRQAQVDWTSS